MSAGRGGAEGSQVRCVRSAGSGGSIPCSLTGRDSAQTLRGKWKNGMERKHGKEGVFSDKATAEFGPELSFVFLLVKDYGKVPGYLQRLREEQLRAQEELDHKQEVLRQLQEEEIRALLENLKKNWNALHDEYQRLSLVTDTQSKRSRKERLEAEMNHLESRIESFQRFKIIYTLTDTHT